jgi:hypothetical protein
MIDLQEKNDVTPLCPHCQQPLHTVWYRRLRGVLGRRYIYFCSACQKTLGVSHRKGFWMG